MPLFTDQLGRTISLDHTPRRIISLVPSQTELLYTLGLEEEVAGITKFCVHPEQWFRHKTKIGGTKNIRPDIIRSLHPDLVIANKEENERTQIEELSSGVPVWISDVSTLPDALRMIRSVGQLTGKEPQAESLASAIARRFEALESFTASGTGSLPFPSPGPSETSFRSSETAGASVETSLRFPGLHTAYFIWRNPWMVAGGGTFIQDMLFRAGFINIFQDQPRYPSMELASLAGSGCELVLLSSEPYPFREKHIEEIRKILPRAIIRLVDGEVFSWYGSRLLQAPAYLQELRSRLSARSLPE